MKNLFILFMWLVTFTATSQYWTPQNDVIEIADNNLNDIAIATMDVNGNPVIYYNPIRANQLGNLVSAFFRAHEYGHHYLGHVINQNNPNQNIRWWLTLNAENDADEYAVRYHINNPNVLRETYNTFMMQNFPGNSTHPSTVDRAQNIAILYYNITGYNLWN